MLDSLHNKNGWFGKSQRHINTTLVQIHRCLFKTYTDTLCISSGAHVFPTVVSATPLILTITAIIFAIFIESWPRSAPKRRVKRPDVEVKIVVLATLVFASAELEKYCKP